MLLHSDCPCRRLLEAHKRANLTWGRKQNLKLRCFTASRRLEALFYWTGLSISRCECCHCVSNPGCPSPISFQSLAKQAEAADLLYKENINTRISMLLLLPALHWIYMSLRNC
ncbi:hypothetical protein MLD38_035967 [Melastoma candidum]|uniref:Uncharacterized protein n=1 Tax=Melastoma candidum TaxID=119954 RepID=A0ACB9LK30_9MYRT|nr:hypothetical protein MLD38_035967 [Melastoma candidum]